MQEYNVEATPPSLSRSNLSVENIRTAGYGGGVGGMVYSIKNGQLKASHSNHRGDVIAKTDASGKLSWFARYNAYGTRFDEVGATHDRQRGNTKDEESSIGIVNDNMRWRTLEHSCYLTRDLIGYEDGPNLYCYVHGNPITRFDPTGLNAASYIVAANGLAPDPQKVAVGASRELASQASAVVHAIMHPIKTAKAMIGNVKETIDDPAGKATEAKDAVAQTMKDLVSMDPDKAGSAFVKANETVAAAVIVAQATKINQQNSENGSNQSMGNSASGAAQANKETLQQSETQTMYGPKNDPKVNPDGSTNGEAWTTPDKFSSKSEAEDKLDMFKPADGSRTVVLPQGTEVQKGTTPGGQSPMLDYKGNGGANETLTPGGLPAGSVQDDWTPLPETTEES